MLVTTGSEETLLGSWFGGSGQKGFKKNVLSYVSDLNLKKCFGDTWTYKYEPDVRWYWELLICLGVRMMLWFVDYALPP